MDLGNEVKPVIRLADTVEVSSLEKTGSKLGHRYKKATRAKDISNATAKDMEVILFSKLLPNNNQEDTTYLIGGL